MNGEEAMEAYEQWATKYDEKIPPVPDIRCLESVEEMVVFSLLRNIEFTTVLDAATGTGRYAVHLAKMGKRVLGIDTSPQMLDQARAKARELQLDIQFRQASVLSVPEADESFDLVICALALAHVKDLAGAVSEFVRVVRRGGHLIISDLHPNIQNAWGPEYTVYAHQGDLLIDAAAKDMPRAQNPNWTATQLSFPNYHGDIAEYLDSLKAAGAHLLSAIDVPMEQRRGLLPGPLVIFARKSNQ